MNNNSVEIIANSVDNDNAIQDSGIIAPIVMPPEDQIIERKISSYNAFDFLSLKFPPKDFIVEPIIPTQGITMIYAQRGVGKTFLSLSIACSAAIGVPILKWSVSKPRKVVYVDGEMSAQTFQERLEGLFLGIGLELPDNDNLKIINMTMQDHCLDLSIEEDQLLLEKHLQGIDLLILDNLSTLTSVKENEADSWLDIQKWLIKLRQKNVSVLLIHHAGKGGSQRGTSRKEDIVDAVINLKHPSDYDNQQGLKFEVVFEKCRNFSGDQAKNFEAKLCGNIEDGFTWEVIDIENALQEKVKELHELGMTQREIAMELGMSQSSICRIMKKNEIITPTKHLIH